MSKQFIAVLVAIVLIFAGIAVFTNKTKSSSNKSTSSVAPTEHVEGATASNVKLVEYGDYECPYCEEYYPVVKSAVSEFSSQISFQFRNFPLVNVHRNAFAGARAAEAASLQNKFWEMHDALYETSNWESWTNASDPTDNFNQYASQLGLNLTQFKADFASSKVNDTVNADISAGNKLNIQGTPAFYLDGKAVSPQPTVAAFEKLIKAELAAKQTTTN